MALPICLCVLAAFLSPTLAQAELGGSGGLAAGQAAEQRAAKEKKLEQKRKAAEAKKAGEAQQQQPSETQQPADNKQEKPVAE